MQRQTTDTETYKETDTYTDKDTEIDKEADIFTDKDLTLKLTQKYSINSDVIMSVEGLGHRDPPQQPPEPGPADLHHVEPGGAPLSALPLHV